MNIKKIIKTPEVVIQEGIDVNSLFSKIDEGKKKLIFILLTTGIALLCLFGFLLLYYIPTTSTDIMTIAIAGIFISASIVFIGLLSGMVSVGTYAGYFLLSLTEKETVNAEIMAELSLLIRILANIIRSAPSEANSVIHRVDIAQELNEHPALRERILAA